MIDSIIETKKLDVEKKRQQFEEIKICEKWQFDFTTYEKLTYSFANGYKDIDIENCKTITITTETNTREDIIKRLNDSGQISFVWSKYL